MCQSAIKPLLFVSYDNWNDDGGVLSNKIKNECEFVIRGSKHRERDEMRCFYCFEVLGTPDEKRSTSF